MRSVEEEFGVKVTSAGIELATLEEAELGPNIGGISRVTNRIIGDY